jgi:excisionase family DNA binding protein
VEGGHIGMEEQLSVGQAARKLGISLDAVYRLLYSGKLEGSKNDGKWHIPTATVEDRLRKRGRQ